MIITPALLRQIMPLAGAKADLFASHLETARGMWVGRDPLHIAMWLAQIAHESGELRYVREIASGAAYEGRKDLGNTQPGDGVRFRGRGLIQLTGRSNYQRFGSAIGVDFLGQPELLETPQYAAMSAGWFWYANNVADLCSAADPVLAVTKRINGGTNGLSERRQYFARAQRVIGSATEMPAPIVESQPSTVNPPAYVLPEDLYGPDGPKGFAMPIPAIVGAVLPTIISSIPDLIKIFGDKDQPVAERNAKAAERVVDVVVRATGAVNAQDAADKIQADPAARTAAQEAVRTQWFEIIGEAGSGGIGTARKADLEFIMTKSSIMHSPSFWIAVLMIPLVYMVMVSILFPQVGGDWPQDIRGTIVGSVVSLVIGSLCGYYFGAVTTRNRASN